MSNIYPVVFFLILLADQNEGKDHFWNITLLESEHEALPLARDRTVGVYLISEDYDFCTITCKINDKDVGHINCNCLTQAGCHTYFPKELIRLRMEILLLVNEYRNRYATFASQYVHIPHNISNMNAVSYDLALEYSARCSAHKCSSIRDTCILQKKHPHPHQVVFKYQGSKLIGTKLFLQYAMMAWFADYPNGLNTDQNEAHKNTTSWKSWQKLLWSDILYIGCYTKYRRSTMEQKNSTIIYFIYIFCNLSSGEKGNETGPLYIIGDPCKNCPKDRKCNERFLGLCGEIEPIPIANLDAKAVPSIKINYYFMASLVGIGIVGQELNLLTCI